jgi:plastocyanin
MRTKKSVAVIASLALIMLAACGGGGSTAPANSSGNNTGNQTGGGSTPVAPVANQIIARETSNSFDPSSITVAVGTTISFTFQSVAHNVIFDASANGRPADIPANNSNTTITRQFNTAGTFSYQCTIHAGMTGTVIVQ